LNNRKVSNDGKLKVFEYNSLISLLFKINICNDDKLLLKIPGSNCLILLSLKYNLYNDDKLSKIPGCKFIICQRHLR
jgi:hypothetical protein